MKNPINPPTDRGPASTNNPHSCVSKFWTRHISVADVLLSAIYEPTHEVFSALALPPHDGKPEVMCPSCALNYVLYAAMAAVIDAHQSVTGYVITRTQLNAGIAAVLDDMLTDENNLSRGAPPRNGGR